MLAALIAMALLAASAVTAQVTRDPPSYSAATIVNFASQDPSALAPYALIQIKGSNLAWDKKSLEPTDIRNSMLPTALPGTGARVFIGGFAAGIISVAPDQITALIPGNLVPGTVNLYTFLDGLAGPMVPITLNQYGPGLFAKEDQTLIATRENGDLVTGDTPLSPGDKVVLHATGLGQSDPQLLGLEIPSEPLPLDPQTVVVVYLSDNPIDPSLILSVSLIANQAGMYQLKIQLPPDCPQNPEIRIEANGFKSPPGFKLPVQSNPGTRPLLEESHAKAQSPI